MIKRIPVADLETGMFIADFNTPYLSHPFLPKQRRVRGAKDIDQMLRCGMKEVMIDTSRGRDSSKALGLREVDRQVEKDMIEDLQREDDAPRLAPDTIPLARELPKARRVYHDARQVVKEQFRDVRTGHPVDGEGAHETVKDLVDSIFRNRNALLSLSRIKSFDEYTFNHSINVAVLALNLAVHMGILDQELQRLGVGAVLHDLGKVRMPDGLIQKPGRFSEAEYEVVKSHAAHGAKLILDAGNLPKECATVPLNHHERYDGSGYPRQLAGLKVGKFGLITGIADVYDAMTTNRPYQKGMPPDVALRMTYQWAGTHFHPIYVRKFIQCLGIFPVGTLVRLDSGEVAVVVRQNRGELLRPWVRLVKAANGAPYSPLFDVDLRDPDPHGVKPFARSILGVLDPADHNVDVDQVMVNSSEEDTPEAAQTETRHRPLGANTDQAAL